MHREAEVPRPRLTLRKLWFAALLFAAAPVFAQSTPAPHFDVISIKPNDSVTENMSWGMQGDSFQASNISLKFLIASAYEIRQDLIQGLPKWATGTHWNIQAKISDTDEAAVKKLTAAQRKAMLQQLVLDGLKLQVHSETHVQSVLELTVAPGGVKMQKHPVGPGDENAEAEGAMSMGNGQMDGTAARVKDIARGLAEATEKSVVDKTGVTGVWDFKLRWAPEGDQNSKEDSLYTAVQEQLGLKLSAGKGPVEFLVVDHMEDPREAKGQ